MQEVRNAVDQAQRELATRFDFKGTDSSVELHEMEIRLHSATEDRLRAVVQVLEEKLVRRKVSLKALDYKGAKGISSQTQGEQVRVSGKKRDDLQAVIAGLREEDFGLPLQFENFRD